MSSRSPLWYCYECNAEMRPVMVPEPHCASCNGTFVEEMDGTGEDDPRQIAAENEQFQTFQNLLHAGLGGSRRQGSPGLFTGPGMFGAGPNGGSVRFEVRGGPGGRSFSIQRGGGSVGGHPIAGFPGFAEFMQQRMHSAPTSPIDAEIETPYGPRFRRPREDGSPQGADDLRPFLTQYLMAMLSGNPALMFDEHVGPLRGDGEIGDYILSQEGLDRVITQLMEATGQHKPNPAPEEMIEMLNRTPLSFECDLVKTGQSCAICTEYFAPPDSSSSSTSAKETSPDNAPDGPQRKSTLLPEENTSESSGVAITLPCEHSFHDDCIIQWLKTNGTCPVCRFSLVEQPGHSEPERNPPTAASTRVASTSSVVPTNPRPNNPVPSASSRNSNGASSRLGDASLNDRSPSPQRQEDNWFTTGSNPAGLLDTVLGLLRGGRDGDVPTSPVSPGGRGPRISTPIPVNEPIQAPSSPRASTSISVNEPIRPLSSTNTTRLRTPTPPRARVITPTLRDREREEGRTPSPRSPHIFFRDRGLPPGSGQNRNGNSGRHVPGGWGDVD